MVPSFTPSVLCGAQFWEDVQCTVVQWVNGHSINSTGVTFTGREDACAGVIGGAGEPTNFKTSVLRASIPR